LNWIDAFYKAAKIGVNGDVKNKGKAAEVEDEEDESEFAGPEMPPDFEEDIPDDEEGRFFGGGMAKETAQAMDYLDRQDQDGEAAVSIIAKQRGVIIRLTLRRLAREN
jgi:beta-catenin-like protein 1